MLYDHVLTNQDSDRSQKDRVLRLSLTHEAALIKAAQQGDLSAFNQLVLAYQDDLYGWVLSHIQDAHTAEDITQQVFITAYQKIHHVRDGSFRAWIFRIARNRSIDEIRTRLRHPSYSLDGNPQDEEAGDFLSYLPSGAPLPEEAVIQAEQARWLQQLLERLPAPFREALLLVDLYEMDYQEAAAVLNLPLGTLKSRVSRARLRMRGLMSIDPALL